MNAYVCKGLNVSCRTIHGEAFIVDEDTRVIRKLDLVASTIWDQINGMTTIEEIASNCCEIFEGNEQEIRSGVQEFIMELESMNLVLLSATKFEGVYVSAC